MSAALADWASIVLAALPYIVAGALVARFSRRLIGRCWHHKDFAIALLAVLNPGCDCALNGFAGALARLRPALAGFALTFAAAASPVSLAVTYAAFGMHMTIARAAGALIAAALTSAAWRILGQSSIANSVVPPSVVGRASLAQKSVVGRASVEFTHLGYTFREIREPSGMVVVWQLPEEGSHASYHAFLCRESPCADRSRYRVGTTTDRRCENIRHLSKNGVSLAQAVES
jgi:uncharacterized membrane protein YraQ (UPF0718 family)